MSFLFIFVPFNSASAYTTICGEGGCNEVYGNSSNTPVYQLPVAVSQNIAPTVVYTNNTNTVQAKPKTVYVQENTTTTQTTNAATTTPANQNNSNGANDNSGSNLAASAIFGSSGFLPSGLIGWILFAIFILVIVILVRRIFGAKEAYEEAPMKYD